MIDDQNILSWRHADYPKLATAVEGGREYVVWEMGPGEYQVAARTPINGLRQRKWLQRLMLPTWEEAFFTAQRWAWERHLGLSPQVALAL